MPTLKVKNRTGTFTQVFPDKLRVKKDGTWVAPRKVYVKKIGDPNANANGWVDTGYTTSPNPPISFGVHSSNFSTINVSWAGPAVAPGVTPPARYEAVIRNSGWGEIPGKPSQFTTGGFASWTGLSQDTAYLFLVRSISATGLVSGWAQYGGGQWIPYATGHPQQTAQRWEHRSRNWRSGEAFVGLWNQHVTGATAPAHHVANGFNCGVVVSDIHMEVWTPYGWTGTWGFLREMYHLGNGVADIGGVMQPFNWGLTFGPSWVASPFRGRWSDGRPWGVWLNGSGYDHKYGAYAPIYAKIILAGIEYFTEQVTYVSVNEVANHHW